MREGHAGRKTPHPELQGKGFSSKQDARCTTRFVLL
jgi:hypothetical protein